MKNISLSQNMALIKSFSVWIYDKKNTNFEAHGHHDTNKGIGCPLSFGRTNHVFVDRPPCNLPKSGFIHLTVAASEDGQDIIGLQADYFFGDGCNDVLTVSYDQLELQSLGDCLVGTGTLVQKIQAYIQGISSREQEKLLCKYSIPCFGGLEENLIHLFIYQLSILLVVLAWLNASCFWENKLFPLYVKFPTSTSLVSKKILKVLSIYFIYVLSMKFHIDLKPIVSLILCLINTWGDIFCDAHDVDIEIFQAELNLNFLKYVIWELRNGEETSSLAGSSKITTDTSKYSTPPNISSASSKYSTPPVVSEVSKYSTPPNISTDTSKYSTPPSVTSTDDRNQLIPIYRLLETKRQEVERGASQANRSLASHFTTLSEEVTSFAMSEVRKRLSGCVEECIYNAYPRIENYITSALEQKSENFSLLRDQLELEIFRVRDTCQQALLALEAVPYYEERIQYLENEVKTLKKHINGNDGDLHRKVEHLQSTVAQLLRTVRCRV